VQRAAAGSAHVGEVPTAEPWRDLPPRYRRLLHLGQLHRRPSS
jgi:hypothetical protein